jgi:hypothetical protein
VHMQTLQFGQLRSWQFHRCSSVCALCVLRSSCCCCCCYQLYAAAAAAGCCYCELHYALSRTVLLYERQSPLHCAIHTYMQPVHNRAVRTLQQSTSSSCSRLGGSATGSGIADLRKDCELKCRKLLAVRTMMNDITTREL